MQKYSFFIFLIFSIFFLIQPAFAERFEGTLEITDVGCYNDRLFVKVEPKLMGDRECTCHCGPFWNQCGPSKDGIIKVNLIIEVNGKIEKSREVLICDQETEDSRCENIREYGTSEYGTRIDRVPIVEEISKDCLKHYSIKAKIEDNPTLYICSGIDNCDGLDPNDPIESPIYEYYGECDKSVEVIPTLDPNPASPGQDVKVKVRVEPRACDGQPVRFVDRHTFNPPEGFPNYACTLSKGSCEGNISFKTPSRDREYRVYIDIDRDKFFDFTFEPTKTITLKVIPDTTPPERSNGKPTGTVTSPLTLELDTDEIATCKYSTSPGLSYESMVNFFSRTGSTHHYERLTLTDGTYSYYVRCMDESGNVNQEDYEITFTVSREVIECEKSSGCPAIDTDGGVNIYQKGTCSWRYCDATTKQCVVSYSQSDSCIGNDVYEMYPDPTPGRENYCKGERMTCTSGKCKEGACVPIEGGPIRILLSASPTSVKVGESSTITAQLDVVESGVTISFETTLGELSPDSCETDLDGKCTVTISSSVEGTATITGTSTGLESGTTTVEFTTEAPLEGKETFTLYKGQNIVGLPGADFSECEIGEFRSVGGDCVYKKLFVYYDPVGEEKGDCGGNYFSSDTMKPGLGYYVYVKSDTCTVSFDVPTEVKITLYPGQNLISVPVKVSYENIISVCGEGSLGKFRSVGGCVYKNYFVYYDAGSTTTGECGGLYKSENIMRPFYGYYLRFLGKNGDKKTSCQLVFSEETIRLP